MEELQSQLSKANDAQRKLVDENATLEEGRRDMYCSIACSMRMNKFGRRVVVANTAACNRRASWPLQDTLLWVGNAFHDCLLALLEKRQLDVMCTPHVRWM